MKFFFVLNVIFLGLAGQSAWAKNFIVGGQDVERRDPVQASTIGIFSPSPQGHSGALCTGTLIQKDIALTAAHCIQQNSKPVLIFNRDLHDSNAVHRQAESVAVNSKWRTHAGKGMDQGDIALIKFNGRLPPGYRKIPSVGLDSDIHSGAKVTLAGYGISNAQTKVGAGRLRKTEVQIFNSRPGKSEMILDQSHGRGACHGDSGGPAFINSGGKIVLAGLTNRSYPNHAPDDCGHQVVYTKVPAYRSWIQRNEKKLEAEPSPYEKHLAAKTKNSIRNKSRAKSVHRGQRQQKIVHSSSRLARRRRHA